MVVSVALVVVFVIGLVYSGSYTCASEKMRAVQELAARLHSADRMIARFRDLPDDSAFLCALIQIAEQLDTDPDYLAAVMQLESRFDPAATNPSGATGLIQWRPDTARALGTTTDALRVMSARQQLAYVEAFYHPFRGRLDSAGTAYMATFLPALVHAPDSRIIAERGSAEPLGAGALTLGQIYAANPGFDSQGAGRYTVGDVKAAAESTLLAARARGYVEPICADESRDDIWLWVAGALGLVMLARRLLR